MSRTALNLPASEALWNKLTTPETLPVTFAYDGAFYRGLPSSALTGRTESVTDKGVTVTMTFALDDRMTVRAELLRNPVYGECEYTVYFENTGSAPTGLLTDLYVLDADLPGEKPVLRSCCGDLGKSYEKYENDLLVGDTFFRSDNGRATHFVFPYFDLVHGDGGTLMALGWAGTWQTLFSAHDGVTTVRGKTDISLSAALMPGETIRTGLVVLLPYRGRNEDDAANLWREWFLAYNAPKMDAQGTPLHPFSNICFSGDTGLPNSDGSISERYFTWKPSLDRVIQEDVLADFRWFDAGWYCDPAGNTVETDWWGTVGTWTIDKVKWPGNSFRESNEAFHAAGMKVFTWFEPERVTHVDDLVKNFGYKKEWGVVHGPVVTNNIGNDECRQWTLDRILAMMDENDVDMFREDNNSDPAFAWGELDRRDEAAFGIPRSGVNENKCIWGHYKLWDAIIAHGAQTGKCTFVDSCASGGGRNDIESMRRGVPMMRSDFDRTTSSMRLSQTTGFCRWIPFHGSSTKETKEQLETQSGAGTTPYVARASMLPIWTFGEAFVHNKNLDYDLLRRNLNEWKSIRHLLVKDMYVLTPWHYNENRLCWTAIAYDDPDAGDSVLLAFRMEDCESPTQTVTLPFVQPDAAYTVTDADTGVTRALPGAELHTVTLTLAEKKSSLLWRIRRAGS